MLVQIKNRTRHTSFTKRLTMAAPDLSSAEWIVEAPIRVQPGRSLPGAAPGKLQRGFLHESRDVGQRRAWDDLESGLVGGGYPLAPDNSVTTPGFTPNGDGGCDAGGSLR